MIVYKFSRREQVPVMLFFMNNGIHKKNCSHAQGAYFLFHLIFELFIYIGAVVTIIW